MRVGVLFGGRSGEHEVSLASAASVIRALDPEKYEAVPIGITKDGRWLVGTGAQKMLPEVLKSGERVILPPDPTAGALVPRRAGSRRPSVAVDVVFPVLHGTFGEDGTVQGLLELAGLPYVGAGVLASAVGMDKDVQKRLFEQAGLPIVPFLAVRRSEWEHDRDAVLRADQEKIPFSGVRQARHARLVGGHDARESAPELPAAMDLAAEFALKIIVERGVNGARNRSLGARAMTTSARRFPAKSCRIASITITRRSISKQGTRLVIPAPLTKKQVSPSRITPSALSASIDGAGMARCDFFLERRTDKIFVNELNTIPGFTSISMYPKLWEASGLPYPKLIDRLIELASKCIAKKPAQNTPSSCPPAAGGASKG